MITRWLIRSFSESRNLRKASIPSGSLPVKWASETKIQSFSVCVNPSTLLPEGWDWLRVAPEQLLLSRSEGRGSSAVERVNTNPLPSHAAVVKPQSSHLFWIVDISQIDEDRGLQQSLDALEIQPSKLIPFCHQN